MSTLKLVNLQHQSSNTPALVLNANNLVSVTGNLNVSNNLVVTGATIHTGTTTFTGNVTAGNLIVSGATTIGGTSVVAVTPGTSANVMTSNGTAWISSAPVVGSLTLLATLTTTSGTTQSATGLGTTSTNYLIVYEALNNATGSSDLNVYASVDNGSTYSGTGLIVSGLGSVPMYGVSMIFRVNASLSNRAATIFGQLSYGSSSKIATTSAAPINALRFSWAAGYTFNGGTIYIYGWN
jgi:hypothetical protein